MFDIKQGSTTHHVWSLWFREWFSRGWNTDHLDSARTLQLERITSSSPPRIKFKVILNLWSLLFNVLFRWQCQMEAFRSLNDDFALQAFFKHFFHIGHCYKECRHGLFNLVINWGSYLHAIFNKPIPCCVYMFKMYLVCHHALFLVEHWGLTACSAFQAQWPPETGIRWTYGQTPRLPLCNWWRVEIHSYTVRKMDQVAIEVARRNLVQFLMEFIKNDHQTFLGVMLLLIIEVGGHLAHRLLLWTRDWMDTSCWTGGAYNCWWNK